MAFFEASKASEEKNRACTRFFDHTRFPVAYPQSRLPLPLPLALILPLTLPSALPSWPTIEPTEPAAPETTSVSPALGLPIFIRPW